MSALESLQKIAKDLEIDIVDKNEEELRAAIKEVESKKKDKNSFQSNSGDTGNTPTRREQEAAFNIAIVVAGSREVRRYTRENHGKDFANFAEQFASKKGFKVIKEQSKPGVVCPSCGHKFYPK